MPNLFALTMGQMNLEHCPFIGDTRQEDGSAIVSQATPDTPTEELEPTTEPTEEPDPNQGVTNPNQDMRSPQGITDPNQY